MAHPLVEDWKSYKASKQTQQPISSHDLVAEWKASRRQPQPPQVIPSQDSQEFKIPRRDFGQDVAGYIEGATLGIPRTVLESRFSPLGNIARIGYAAMGKEIPEIPRGSKGGQLVGSFAGFGGLSRLVGKVPFLASRAVKTAGPVMGGVKRVSNDLLQRGLRGSVTGALGINAPSFTELDTKPAVRAARTVAGGIIGGTAEAVAPPIIEGMAGKVPSFLRGVRRILHPTKRTFEETAKGRAGQIESVAEGAVRTEKEMIGKELAPKASEIAKRQVEQMNPKALKQAGIDEKDVSFIQSFKGQYGATKLPTEEEAGKMFSEVMKKVPGDYEIDIKGFKGNLGSFLREKGIIDKSGSIRPGITKDSRAINGLIDVYKNLKGRIAGEERIPGLLSEATESGNLLPGVKSELNNILRNPTKIDKSTYERTKMGLKALLSSDEQANIPIYRMIRALDDAAERAGIEGFKKARTTYAVSKIGAKAKVQTSQEMQTKLTQSLKPENESIRKNLREQLGSEADTILDKLGKGRIAKDEATRQLKNLQTKVSRQNYLTRKSKGVKTIGGNLLKGSIAAGGTYYTWRHLKDIIDTLKGQQPYNNRR